MKIALPLLVAMALAAATLADPPASSPPPASLAPAASPVSQAEIPRLVADLAGPDLVAQQRAVQRLPEAGPAAIVPLARLLASSKQLPTRLVVVELIGRIGTPAGVDALTAQLRAERDLAVRGQICIQLGELRDPRAVPVIVDWLKTIGPRSLNDVGGPKEVQPSTCYIRHIEALAMIGDARAIAALEQFRRAIPQGVGYGGFITHFVTEATDEAIEAIREQTAFWAKVNTRAGLAPQARLLLDAIRRDRVGQTYLHEWDVIRATPAGRRVLERWSQCADPAVADAAAAMLVNFEQLKAK